MNYLIRLQTRMEKVGFPPDDRLYKLVANAYDAAHRLSVEIHYLSCKGVGRPTMLGTATDREIGARIGRDADPKKRQRCLGVLLGAFGPTITRHGPGCRAME
jgi:hypothetical protein